MAGHGQVGHAVEILNQILDHAPENVQVHLKLKDIYLRAGLMDKAAYLDFVIEVIRRSDGQKLGTIGLDRDLNVAMRNAVRAAVRTIVERTGMRADAAYAYLSAAGDFHVSQVVDGVVGVHATIAKRDFSS